MLETTRRSLAKDLGYESPSFVSEMLTAHETRRNLKLGDERLRTGGRISGRNAEGEKRRRKLPRIPRETMKPSLSLRCGIG